MRSRRTHLYWQADVEIPRARTCSVRGRVGVPWQDRAAPDSDSTLSVEELEAGLRLLDRLDTDKGKFWDEKGRAFRATVRLAIRETAEALLLRKMSRTLRAELEGQLAWLINYLKLQERH